MHRTARDSATAVFLREIRVKIAGLFSDTYTAAPANLKHVVFLWNFYIFFSSFGFLFIFSLPFYKKVPRSVLGLLGAAYKGFIGIFGWDIGELMRTRLSDRHIKLTIIDLFFLSALFFFRLLFIAKILFDDEIFFLFVFSTAVCEVLSRRNVCCCCWWRRISSIFCMEPSGLSLSTTNTRQAERVSRTICKWNKKTLKLLSDARCCDDENNIGRNVVLFYIFRRRASACIIFSDAKGKLPESHTFSQRYKNVHCLLIYFSLLVNSNAKKEK